MDGKLVTCSCESAREAVAARCEHLGMEAGQLSIQHVPAQSGQLTPIDLIVEERFHRAAPGGMGGTKAAGNYSPVRMPCPCSASVHIGSCP